MRNRSNAMTLDSDQMNELETEDREITPIMTRAQRDAMRIHAQQVLACLTLPKESRPSPAALIYLLSDLKKVSADLANDYAANNERAFHQKEYDKWKKIEAVCAAELAKITEYQNEFGATAHHSMGRGIATHLISDMSNLSYVLAMNVASILKTTSVLAPALSGVAGSFAGAATAMNSAQPFIGIGLYSALVVVDTVCIAKHNYEREIEGHKKKREQAYTKLLEHGRWMQWVNASAWILAGSIATLSIATPIIIVSAMACAIIITSMVRIVHQSVELKKLRDVRQSYIKQLAEELVAPEKKEALEILVAKLTHKIKIQQSKLLVTSALTAATMTGIGITAGAIALGAASAAFFPLLIVGAAILLIAGLITVITNRHAIGAAFKTLFKKRSPATDVARPVETNSCSDEDFDAMSTCPEPDPELDELNQAFGQLCDGADEEKAMDPGEGNRYVDRVPEQERTRRMFSSMARIHRPPTGKSQDVVDAIDKHGVEKRAEALAENKNDEREAVG